MQKNEFLERDFCGKHLFWITKETRNASPTSNEMYWLQQKLMCVFKFGKFITWHLILTQKSHRLRSKFLQHLASILMSRRQ